MNNEVREKLKELVKTYGVELCTDIRKTEGLLRDHCGGHKREIAVLVSAIKHRIPEEILITKGKSIDQLQFSRLVKRLQDNEATVEECAKWAVESWIVALSMRIDTIHSSSGLVQNNEELQKSNTQNTEENKKPGRQTTEGEKWTLERILPSGLFLGIKRTLRENVYGIFTGKRFERKDYDFRKFQYDVERHQREKPLLHVDRRETISLAWHPTKLLLVTTGVGGVTKLWDIQTGNLLTESPHWDSYSNGDAVCWSHDGLLFADQDYMFDGNTGDALKKDNPSHDYVNGFGSRCFSMKKYEDLRGFSVGYSNITVSHCASTYNFTPWKPNSKQCLIGQIHSDKGILFRNGLTGEVEKVISYKVSSPIEDFAWHPGGRFVAVAFKGQNVSIIDIDNETVMNPLSSKYLAGWSPDGNILVIQRELWKNDFLIWDVLNMEESAIPPEMKDEIWFKRFFTNISADGLRYLKIEKNTVKIFSTASDALVATLTLPEHFNKNLSFSCATWSPIDGGLLATCAGSETQIWRLE